MNLINIKETSDLNKIKYNKKYVKNIKCGFTRNKYSHFEKGC